MIVVDLRKQQAFDANPKAIQQINFTASLDRTKNTRIYLIIEEAKETVLEFSQGTVKVCKCNSIQYNFVNNLIFISIKWHNTTV